MAEPLERQVQGLLDGSAEGGGLASRVAGMGLSLDEGKIPQSDAAYVDPGPEPYTCENCDHIQPGGRRHNLCEVVAGKIQPSGACRYFAAESEEEGPEVPKATAHVMVTPKVGIGGE